MARMGQKHLRIDLTEPLDGVPAALAKHAIKLTDGGKTLIYAYDTSQERTGITALLQDMQKAGLHLVDLQTQQSTLEDIFVGLVKEAP